MEDTKATGVIGGSVSKKTKLSYCFGGVGRDMAYHLFSGWLFTFILLTNRITASQQLTLTALFIVSKIWDGFNDPIMGLIIERTRTKIGKFKPWLLLGAVTNSLVLMVIFTSSMYGITGWGYVIFMTVMYLLWDITFTMNDISYWSMLPALSQNDDDRNKMSSMANLLAGAGAGLVAVTLPLFTAGKKTTIGGNNIVAYAVMSAVICAAFIGCTLLTFFGVKELKVATKEEAPVESGYNFRKLFKTIKVNDQLRWTSIVMLIYNAGAAVLSVMMTIYIYITYGYEGQLVTQFTIIYGIMGALPMILFPKMAKKFGRKKMMWTCISISCLGYLLFFLFGFTSGTKGFYMLALCGVLINFGQCLFYNILTVNISNAVEYNEWLTGNRDEGIIFSLRPLMAKFGSAMHFGIMSLTYLILRINDITNYISGVERSVYQGEITNTQKATLIADKLASIDPSVITKLRVVMTFLPILLLLTACYICYKKCTIDETRYIQILQDLANRKEEQGKLSQQNIDQCKECE